MAQDETDQYVDIHRYEKIITEHRSAIELTPAVGYQSSEGNMPVQSEYRLSMHPPDPTLTSRTGGLKRIFEGRLIRRRVILDTKDAPTVPTGSLIDHPSNV